MANTAGNLDGLINRCTRLKAANCATFAPFLEPPAATLGPRGHGPWDERILISDNAGEREAGPADRARFNEPGNGLFAGYSMRQSQVTESDIYDKVRKIYECASILELRATYVPEDAGERQEIHLHNANFCGQHQLCRICASRREQQLRRRFEKPIKEAAAVYPWAYLLTLTIRDGADLSERIDRLKKSIRSFVRMGQRRAGQRSRGEWGKVGAAFSSMEVKRGENSGQWHVHTHALIFAREMVDFRVYDPVKRAELELKYGRGKVPREELAAAEMYHVVFDGKPVAVSKVSGEWIRATHGEGISIQPKRIAGTPQEVFDKCKNQVLKYNVKFSPADRADIPELVRDTFNRRFLSTYGDFRHVAVEDLVDEETAGSKEIYISRWEDGRYSDPAPSCRPIETEDMDDTKKRYLAKQAGIIGAYRSLRRLMLEHNARAGFPPGLAAALDRAKADFRSGLERLWATYRAATHKREDLTLKREYEEPALDIGPPTAGAAEMAFAL